MTKNSNNSLHAAVLSLSGLTLIALAGCQDTGPKNSEFFTLDEVRSVDSAIDHQKANGDRQDAMLREQHFDGARLNALGRAKLDRMMAQSSTVTVYLPDAPSVERHQAVLAYANDHGRSETDLKIVNGLNIDSHHPASAELARINKTELGGKAETSDSNDSNSAAWATPTSGPPTATAKHGG
jgi:hypothetical protein